MPVNLETTPNQIEGKDCQAVVEGEVSSIGIMLFNRIPINQNDRFKKAYGETIISKGGGRLLNPVIEEQWFWVCVL